MLPIYAALTFLTMDQALRALSKVSKEPVTREDLLSLCVDGQCKLYVEMDGVWGITQFTGHPGEVQEKVFDAGTQLVQNVRAVRRARPGMPFTIRVKGAVFLDDDSFVDQVLEWEAKVDIDAVELHFRSGDISNLAESLASMAQPIKKLGGKERESYNAVVAALALVAGLDLNTPYAAHTVLAKAGENKVDVPSANTIKKIFDEAASLLPESEST